jgi:glycosyltransferase involved in cell wall biosynthesis
MAASNESDANAPAAMTNVLFVNTPTRRPLGADTFIQLQIARALDRRRHRVHIACAPGPPGQPTPTYTTALDIPDVSVVRVDFGTELPATGALGKVKGMLAAAPALASFLRLARYVRARDISIIHTSDRPRDALACVALARLTRTRCVINLHNGYGEWLSRGLRWALQQADALIACSGFVRQTFVDAGYDPERTVAVLNAIDPARWVPGDGRREVREEFGIGADDPVILSVCRLFREKGVGELIRAVATVRTRFPEVRLLIAGTDPFPGALFQRELEALIDELRLDGTVRLLGHRPDVPHLMAAADVYAMPSLFEPFGLVYAEAMATEVPVIALDTAGAKEVVDNGRTGLLSAPGDEAALVANLERLLGDAGLRRRMGVAGRRRVEEHFTIERMGADVAAVYRDVLRRPRSIRRRRIRGR